MSYKIEQSLKVGMTSTPTQLDPKMIVTLNPKYSTLKNIYDYRIVGKAEGGAYATLDM